MAPRKILAFVVAAVGLEALLLKLRGGRFGGSMIVRCRAGHLFTTTWIPGASLKAVRLGPWRLQRCPVGRHWSFVSAVKEASLSEQERHGAAAVRDSRIP
jgi:hypothetical protein